MSSASNRHEREQGRLFYLPRLVGAAVQMPIAPFLGGVPGQPAPLELVDPQLVRDPVALPVVRPRVYQDAHAAVKQARDVVLCMHGPFVHVGVKTLTHRGRARREIIRRFNAQQFARLRAVEVGFDHIVFFVAQGAFARLPTAMQPHQLDTTRWSGEFYTFDISYTFLPKFNSNPSASIIGEQIER